LERLGPQKYGEALDLHRRLLRGAFERHNGYEVDNQGDAFFVVFADAEDAVIAAAEAQKALARTEWQGEAIRVRMGIHSGEPLAVPPNYMGMDVHRQRGSWLPVTAGRCLFRRRRGDESRGSRCEIWGCIG
jgi:class 3 adenylate cyclase